MAEGPISAPVEAPPGSSEGAPVLHALARAIAALPGGGEARPGQAAMAEAVARAIHRGRHLVVQAGTGTGKSLAYLVPAVLSGHTVVVATATKALQDQLAHHDLPLLDRHLPGGVASAVLKGRSNYLCRQRAAEAVAARSAAPLDQRLLEDPPDTGVAEEIEALVAWAADHPTGDRADLPWEPSPRAWSALSVSSRECPGAGRCPSGDTCFAELARQRAARADVVVVNTHLYGVHLASGGFVLPDHQVVVIDEAHELEDIAASTFGVEVTAGRLSAVARLVGAVVDDPAVADLDGAGTRLIATFGGRSDRRIPAGDPQLDAWLTLARGRVERAVAALRRVPDRAPPEVASRASRAHKACGSLLEDLDSLAGAGADDVVWLEGPEHQPVLRAAPVDVGPALAAAAWGDVTAVLTSATVPTNLAARVGLPTDTTDQVAVPSPFDYRSQALLYCARHLPDPRSPAWAAAAHEELAALMAAAGGRTLALFTSWRAMRAAAEAVRATTELPVLVQGELPKPALVEAFAGHEATCLFATMSFWQGVDVPGRSLSLVVIDRLPFARPDDPLWSARRDRAGPAAFRTVDVPRAAILLAQGAGRLIRGRGDQGVVAVLDPRLATAGYRRELLALMPPLRRTVERAEVEAFLAACTAAAPEPAG